MITSRLSALILLGSFTASYAEIPEDQSRDLVENYSIIVRTSYEDALQEVRNLHAAVEDLVYEPSPASFDSARTAWIAARLPYLQTEVYRFDKGPADDEHNVGGLINSWPLDVSAIGQVLKNADEYPEISTDVLKELNGSVGSGKTITGYHAVEYFLWGDRAGTYDDFVSDPDADRRNAYLLAAVELIAENIEYLKHEWTSAIAYNFHDQFSSGNPAESVRLIVSGLQKVSSRTLENVRVIENSNPDDDTGIPSVYSGTTALDIEYSLLGIRNVWMGEYRQLNGEIIQGLGVRDLVALNDEALSKTLEKVIQGSIEFGKALEIESRPHAGEVSTGLIHSLESQVELVNKARKLLE